MALPDWTLANWAQLTDYLRGDVGKQGDRTELERVLRTATNLIEKKCNRRLVFRGTSTQWTDGEGYTEYHTIDNASRWFIYLEEAPVQAVSLFAEDSTGQFSPGTVFVEGTDFRIHKVEGKLVRVVGGGVDPSAYITGVDVLKVIYSAGYLSTPSRGNVPDDLKEACLEVAGLLWREEDRRKQGLKSESSGVPGSVSSTRFDPFKVAPHIMQMIGPYIRHFIEPTFRRE